MRAGCTCLLDALNRGLVDKIIQYFDCAKLTYQKNRGSSPSRVDGTGNYPVCVCSELDGLRRLGEGGEGRGPVGEVQDLGVAVVLVVHPTEGGVGVKHVLFGLDPLVGGQLPGDPEPFAVHEGAELDLRVFVDLPGYGLDLAGLDVEPPLKQVYGAKGPDPGLIALHGGEVIGPRLLQKFIDLVHGSPSCKFNYSLFSFMYSLLSNRQPHYFVETT